MHYTAALGIVHVFSTLTNWRQFFMRLSCYNIDNEFRHIIVKVAVASWIRRLLSGAPNEKIVQNPCNIAFLNVF